MSVTLGNASTDKDMARTHTWRAFEQEEFGNVKLSFNFLCATTVNEMLMSALALCCRQNFLHQAGGLPLNVEC